MNRYSTAIEKNVKSKSRRYFFTCEEGYNLKKKTDNMLSGCGEIGTFTSGGSVKSFSCNSLALPQKATETI